MSKAVGRIKWFKNKKGYGYIIGYDEETYYFDIVHSIKKDEIYQEGDIVEFEPMFESKLMHAKKVEKAEKHIEEKYDPKTLFKNKKEVEVVQPIKIKENNIFIKMLKKIKAFLKM